VINTSPAPGTRSPVHRLAIARLWYEASSFTPVPTTLAQFRQREWTDGTAAADFYRGTRTEIGAALDFLESHPNWHAGLLRCAAASPGGPVEESDLQTIFDEIVEGIRALQPDAVYLSLHGALIGSRTLCADLALVRRVRSAIGRRPLAVSFDLHANVPEEIAQHVDILCGYRTHPHVDMYETAQRALNLLDRWVSGEIRPVVAVRKVGAILPSFNMRTESGPMADIEQLADAAVRDTPGLLDITPFGGFAYADTPCAGASAVAVADSRVGIARTAADRLAAAMSARAEAFRPNIPNAPEALTRALRILDARSSTRPVALVEPSDNPLSGGAGDTPGLLRAWLDARLDLRCVFAFFWDPDLVDRCHAAGVGGRITARLGARLATWYGEPVEIEAQIAVLTDGRFRNHGPMETGLAVDLGRTAVIRSDHLQVILTESCQAPNDLGYFRLHGIDLGDVDVLLAKAKNHFRAAFTPLCEAILDAETPGPAMAAMARLPFRNLSPELYAGIGLAGPTPA
jgi:microcystin degradation protein MlrC